MKNISGKNPSHFIKKTTFSFTIPTEDEYFNDWANKNHGIYYVNRRKNGDYSCRLWKTPFQIDSVALDDYVNILYSGKYWSFHDSYTEEDKMRTLYKNILQYRASTIQSFFDEHCGKGRVKVSARSEEMRLQIPVSPSKFKMIINDKVI